MNYKISSTITAVAAAISGCAPVPMPVSTVRPSMVYSQAVRTAQPNQPVPYQAGAIHMAPVYPAGGQFASPTVRPALDVNGDMRGARARFVKDTYPGDQMNSFDGGEQFAADGGGSGGSPTGMVTNLGSPGSETAAVKDDVYVYRSAQPNVRDYRGPLALGDPGLSASLWRESRGGNDLYRDHRAYQAMDLVTILVTESAEGNNDANTETKSKTTMLASISKFFGVEQSIADRNPNLDPTALIEAATQNDFKGEGKTRRKGNLKAKISAMVVEILPNGILRVEGEKIVSVNNEEQILVISGLVRPFDLNSDNEVDSSKVANMRIDYYGNGTVGETQYGGWLARMLRILWPF